MPEEHKKFLLKAHNLAKKQFGYTFPNPSVGCIIVKNGNIISKAVTASEGRPHAEELAIKKAGKKTIGATMYVTLEPCFHNSIYGSCAKQIIQSGIKKIYIAKIDPDIRTNNKSILLFKKNKIKTYVGTTSRLTAILNNFFFFSLKNKIPFIKVKMAISTDEKIAQENYKSKWISNSKSREYAHHLRLHSQVILTTSKTMIKDNPRFTIRKKNKTIKYMSIIIIDKYLNTPITLKVFKTLKYRKIFIFTSIINKKSIYLKKIGCEIIIMQLNSQNNFNLRILMKKIFKLNINNILVESGGIFFTNLLKSNLVNELHLFKAPIVIGKKGIPLLVNDKLNNFIKKEISNKKFGKDVYKHYFIR